jgi:hypothetical protein
MNDPNNPASRRNFIASAGILTAGFFLPSLKAFEDTSPVTTIINEAAKSPITVQKLRSNISMLEGSGGNIIVFAGREGKLMVDAGIDVSKEKMKKVLAGISDQPVKYLINTHWHFDHASGNEWVHGSGATIIAHGNTKKNLAKKIRVEDWNYTFPQRPKERCRLSSSRKNTRYRSTERHLSCNTTGPHTPIVTFRCTSRMPMCCT